MNRITLGSFVADSTIIASVIRVLESGRLSYGEESAEYERRFAAMHGCSYGVVSNSGTSSLHVAIQALKEIRGWQDGDEVIVPSLTFVATVNVILHNNLKPVFVDVNLDSYCIHAGLVADAITTRTVAIMPVHLFGHPANMPEIMSIADGYGLAVIEDACEAMLAKVEGISVGSWGDVGCFSTYAAHHMVTGVGGMAVTNDENLAMHMRSLVNHGISLDGLPNGQRYDPSFLSRKFRFDRVGHSFRMTELEAAIGLAQLDKVENYVMKRRRNALDITESLAGMGLPIFLPKVREGCYHTWMVYPILLDRGIDRGVVMRSLNQFGVETREMMPLINQPCYRDLGIVEEKYPNAVYVNDYGLYVGVHQELIKYGIRYLVNSISDSILEAIKLTS